MLKKLRRQFILIAMLSVGIVLTVIVASINIANYVSVNRNLNARLELISDNGGVFPDLAGFVFETDPDDAEMQEGIVEEPVAPENQDGTAPEPPKTDEKMDPDQMSKDLSNRGISGESQYDTRYFTVLLDADGTTVQINTDSIISVNSGEAEDYAQILFAKGKTDGTGYMNDCRYMITEQTDADGNTCYLYVFVNCAYDLQNLRTFLMASVGISIGGLVVVFILVMIFSNIIVRPMAESYEKQKRFITDASHEIKTPLTIIDANTEVIEMMEGENEWTEGIRKQIKRLTALTDKLVFLSRMDEEATKLELIDFPISDVIQDVAEGFKAVAEAKGKKLEIEITPNRNYCGDEKNIRQLVSLLLDNAMKYSSENGCIRLHFSTNGKNQVLTVWNTVDNIEKGNLDVLFDRFYRAESSRNTKTGGFGIGLSVAQAIVNAHKGKISAKSEDGKSILFTVTL